MSKRENSSQENFLDYTKLGTVGRRAGVQVPRDIQRDEYGMEDVDAFFSANATDDPVRVAEKSHNNQGQSQAMDDPLNNTPDRPSRIEQLTESIRKMRSSSAGGLVPISAKKSHRVKETPPRMLSKYDEYVNDHQDEEDKDKDHQLDKGVTTVRPERIKLPDVDPVELSFVDSHSPAKRSLERNNAYLEGFDRDPAPPQRRNNVIEPDEDDAFVHHRDTRDTLVRSYSPLPTRERGLNRAPRLRALPTQSQAQPQYHMDISTPLTDRHRRYDYGDYTKRRRGSNSSLSDDDADWRMRRKPHPRSNPNARPASSAAAAAAAAATRIDFRMRPAVRQARDNTESLREALNADMTFQNELDDYDQGPGQYQQDDPVLRSHGPVSDAVETFFEAKVVDYPSKTRKRTRIVAWGPTGPEMVTSRDKEYSIGTLFDQDRDFVATGTISMEPYGFKPSRPTKHNTYVFYVIFGFIEVDISGTAMRLRAGSSFEVPRGNLYSLRNLSRNEKARLFFVQATDTRKRKT